VILETDRLRLRRLTPDDGPFILRLLNEPSWLRFIGDRGVRTLEDASAYILNGPMAMYESHGFGLYMVELKQDGTPIGMCGILKRPALEDPDVGFALVPEHWSKGYAFEAAKATLDYAVGTLGLKRIAAIVNPENEASIALLTRLGMRFEKVIRLTEDAPELQLLLYESCE
jgi:RimJ/RimL family protein N-acetyltransferase